MLYPDLSPYEYSALNSPAELLNVGWLDSGNPFPSGVVPAKFVDQLVWLTVNFTTNLYRGWHDCAFCDCHNLSPLDQDWIGEGLTKREGRVSLGPHRHFGPHFLIAGEMAHLIGHGSVFVMSLCANRCFVAPDLLIHYVDEHDYLPPEEFIEAVMEMTEGRAKRALRFARACLGESIRDPDEERLGC